MASPPSRRKTSEVQPMTTSTNVAVEKKVSIEKTFTTNDKGYRKHTVFTSGKRRNQFMLHLKERGLTGDIITYNTLKYEFTLCFGSNEQRTIIKYLGRPSYKVMVKPKRRFAYPVTVPKKTGLMETLGYITRLEEPNYKLNWGKVQRINVCVPPLSIREREEEEAPPHTLPPTPYTHKYSLEKRLSPREKLVLEAAKKEASA